jgi:hypothetical protein
MVKLCQLQYKSNNISVRRCLNRLVEKGSRLRVQIEELLKVEPNNEEYLEMAKSLDEVISMARSPNFSSLSNYAF